jgi:8-oxo-dGTP pyrophosphatase MutT (NUDIX family)
VSVRRFMPIPPDDLPRVRAIIAGEAEPVPLRDAATIALIRDGDAGLEVYLMRRVRGMAFAGGVHVFPGGAVDEQDAAARTPWHGPGPAWWAQEFGLAVPRAAALVTAAVRETFEECGVLLAGQPDGSVLADAAGPGWEADRQDVDTRARTLDDVLSDRGLQLRTDLLRPLAHWVTPVVETRRYDTCFFLAALPAGQESREAGSEADARLWIRPADALEQELAMLPPTRAVLGDLARFDDTAAAMAAARSPRPLMLRPVLVTGGVELHSDGF